MIVSKLSVGNKKYKINVILNKEITGIQYTNPKKYNHVSRYSNTRRIFDDYNNIYYHETVSDYKISESEEDTFITVDKVNNRLDTISYNVYGVASYWWVIGLANNIIDSFAEIPLGTVLRIPPLISLYRKGNVLER